MDEELTVDRNAAGQGQVNDDDNMWTIDIENPTLELIFPNVVVEWTAIQITLSEDLEKAMEENVEAKFEVVEKDSNEYNELLPTSGEQENWPMPLNEKMRLPRDVFVTKIQITLIFPPGFAERPNIPEMKINVEIFGCTERK